MLTLSEELFLLTMNEKKNSLAVSSAHALPAALSGAIFVELIQNKMVQLDENSKVSLVEPAPADNKNADHFLKKIASAKKPKKLEYWIGVFSLQSKKLHKEIVSSLIEKKILKEKKGRLLWVIPFLDYSQADASAKFWRKRHLRAIILAGEKIDPQSAALLSLLKASGLLDHVFTNDEIKFAGKRADDLLRDEALASDFIKMLEKISTAARAAITAVESD